MTKRKLGVLLTGIVAVSAAVAAAALAGNNPSGFKTDVDPMLTAGIDRPDVTIQKIISVGDTLPGGYMFNSIPDGVSINPRGNGRLDVFVNHETSTVPFPVPLSGQPTIEQTAQNDYDDSSLSVLALNQHSKGVLHGWTPITGEENWQRFCSNYLATEKEGFDRKILFLNEESPDAVNRSGVAWPLTAGGTNPEQPGYVVAYDIKSGERKKIPGMGRHNHENSVPVPGYDDLVVLSGDDTFVTNPAQSQVYAYVAEDTDTLWNDEGDLYGLVLDNPAINDYYDFIPGMDLSGTFTKIDKTAATGDQTALELASDAANVFQFVRIEDIAYDKRARDADDPVVVYLADSGRAQSGGPAPSVSTNGRIWRLALDPNDPKKVLSLTVLVNGDDSTVKTFREIHQPDNLETTPNSLLVTEDPSSGNQFLTTDTDTRKTAGRVWRIPLTASGIGTPEIALAVDQALDEAPGYDVDAPEPVPAISGVAPISPGRLGAWEASGIVDASSIWGPGWFLVDVQAHTLWVAKESDPVNSGFTRKREGGQLLAVHIPGA
jgi:hypothetical protein